MQSEKVVLPCITLHGSNRQSLQNEYLQVLDNVRQTIQAYQRVDFHPRDYSTYAEFRQAEEQRVDIFIQLYDMQSYLETIIESI